VTRPHKIKTVVSLNPIMVDGTGMCGGCRVKLGDEVKFACVDGPDFDGHKVDFNDLMMRLRRYAEEEKAAMARWSESCRMGQPVVNGGHNAPWASQLPPSPATDQIGGVDPFEQVPGG
jgi:hypothetical protein